MRLLLRNVHLSTAKATKNCPQKIGLGERLVLSQLRNMLADFRIHAAPGLAGLGDRTGALQPNLAVLSGLEKAALLDAMEGVVFLLDGERRITGFGQEFAAFAKENGAPELADPSYLFGRPIFDFIEGEDVRDAYRRVFDVVEKNYLKACTVIFRCDSPTLQRTMRMAVTMISRQYFLCQSILLSESEVRRPPIALFDFRAQTANRQSSGNLPLLPICSMCQQIRVMSECSPNGEWISAEEYYSRGGATKVLLTHGLCPECSVRWKAEWLKQARKKPKNQ